MAFWTILILATLLGLWIITGDVNNIVTSQSLTLLGISSLTALGATFIDGAKPLSKDPQGDPVPPPGHISFFKDILTDDSGWTFHRIQMVIWTLVLGAASLCSAYHNLVLPNLDPNLLALMGISSGLYLGFKWPEQQSNKPLP
jgi:hypothetical protein